MTLFGKIPITFKSCPPALKVLDFFKGLFALTFFTTALEGIIDLYPLYK